MAAVKRESNEYFLEDFVGSGVLAQEAKTVNGEEIIIVEHNGKWYYCDSEMWDVMCEMGIYDGLLYSIGFSDAKEYIEPEKKEQA